MLQKAIFEATFSPLTQHTYDHLARHNNTNDYFIAHIVYSRESIVRLSQAKGEGQCGRPYSSVVRGYPPPGSEAVKISVRPREINYPHSFLSANTLSPIVFIAVSNYINYIKLSHSPTPPCR